ncbi:uncharacterized protein [Haliotis cracherodii]|uniref:uncharacterized protein n=1 Tax=Haliotis cracherodii TaxID=6455 RepID=UPI0039E93653
MEVLLAAVLACLLHVSVGNLPPSIDCPQSFTTLVKPGQRSAAVTWNVPTASDPEQGKVIPKLTKFSPSPGSMLTVGTHIVKYSATDKEGRSDHCTFTITVEGAQCLSIGDILHGRTTCNQGARYGEKCSVVCDSGYEVLADNSFTCLRDGRYDKPAPVCEEVGFYTLLCRNITSSRASTFLKSAEKNFQLVFEQLQSRGYIPIYKSTEYAKKMCQNADNSNHGVCVYLRRLALFEKLKEDIKTLPVTNSRRGDDADNNLIQYTYRRLMTLHPEIHRFCDDTNFINDLYNDFPNVQRIHDKNKYQRILGQIFSGNLTFDVLKSEANKVCSPDHEGPDCLLRDVLQLIERAKRFIAHQEKIGRWDDEDVNHYFNALTFSSILLKWKYHGRVNAIQPHNTTDQQAVITQIIRAVAMYIDDGADEKLEILMSMFPYFNTDKICNSGKMCLFWRVVDQTRVYIKSRQPATGKGVKVLLLNTDLDLREFLRQKQMERVLQFLGDQEYNLVAVADDLKNEFSKVINQRFYELKTYFKKIHSFSAAKAKADLIVFHQLNNLTQSARTLAPEIDSDISIVIGFMMTSAALEVTEKTINFAVVMAESCNPLKAATDSSVSDIMDATAELVNALATLGSATRLVIAIHALRGHINHVRNGFAKNKEFIGDMKTIMESITQDKKPDDFEAAKDRFLKKYNDYVPAVSKPDVTEMAVYFNKVLEEACKIIEGTSTSLAAVPKAFIGSSGLCWTTAVKIEKLVSTLESIYDKQYELVEVLAQNVQSQVAMKAADGIVADYDAIAGSNGQDEDVLESLRQVSGMSYVCYRIMVLQVIRMYCDELQYKAGGVRPHVCKDAGTDISTLLAYKEPPCSSRGLEFQTVSGRKTRRGDTAYMSISKLYSGQEISFKIPNSRWLYKAGWITKADLTAVIYVSGFEVYLPSEVRYRRDIRVHVEVDGENELVPGGTRYTINPSRPMVFEYKVGHGVNCRQHRGYDNPYTTCHTNKIPDVCPKTEYSCFVDGGDRVLHPSIFSRFKIRVNGYEDLPGPNPTTPVPVKVAVRTCAYIPSRSDQQFQDQFRYQGRNRLPSTCCPEEQYWSGRHMACRNCPNNSTVALRGYYCEKQAD